MVGAGLLAKAVCQSVNQLTDTPLSSERRPEQARSHKVYDGHKKTWPGPGFFIASQQPYRRIIPTQWSPAACSTRRR